MRADDKPKNAGKTFARILQYVSKYKLYVIIIVLAILGSAVANLFGTYQLKNILNVLENPDPTWGISEVISELGSKILILMAIYIAGVILGLVYQRLLLTVCAGTLRTLRDDMFTHMERLPIRYFDRRTHGEIMARYTTDTDAIREMLSNGIPNLINSAITIVGSIVMMFILSPLLSLFALGMIAIMVACVAVIGGKGGKYFIRQQKTLADVNGYIEEYIDGQKVVQVFCHEEQVKKGFGELNDSLCKTGTSAMTFSSILMPIMGNLSYINYVVTALVGGWLVISGKMDGVAVLIPFLQYSRNISQPITQVSQQFHGIMTALAGAERVFELMDTEPETDDGYVTLVNAVKDADGNITESEERTGHWAWKHYHKATDTTTYVELRGAVEFEKVTFGYDPDKTVLKDVTMYAKPGQKIALVGSTGAGKTTITNLINRFYDVPDGKIRYDGININKIKKDDLRHSLSMVLQDTHLFTGTVRENIRYGNLNATDEQVEAAAKLANAHYFITHMPDGYDTVITADGANLSQGQRQLLAIARAAVADPPVLILDEATSSIDTRTEALIEQGMDKLMEGRTVFVIAHRLSTVRNANVILVIENGEIIERGNHDELLEQKGKYYQLYNGMFELS